MRSYSDSFGSWGRGVGQGVFFDHQYSKRPGVTGREELREQQRHPTRPHRLWSAHRVSLELDLRS